MYNLVLSLMAAVAWSEYCLLHSSNELKVRQSGGKDNWFSQDITAAVFDKAVTLESDHAEEKISLDQT